MYITELSSLNEMIEAGLPKFATQLEEISASATKEYALEKNLEKMKSEWEDIVFECVPYRETGVHILAAVDDIQVMLDDHILKAQTMRGSPYIKPFEAEMQAWEEKLIMMQDILEQWLTVSIKFKKALRVDFTILLSSCIVPRNMDVPRTNIQFRRYNEANANRSQKF